MTEAKTEEKTAYDPFEPFRGMRDAYLESLSKTMIDVVNTESYAQATGAMLDYYLTASAPFREALEKGMLQTMQQLSFPSRQELANLAERFTNVEMRLDDLGAKLDGLAKDFAGMRQASKVEMRFDDLSAKLDSMAKELVAMRPASKVEMRLDDLGAKLDGLAKELVAMRQAAAKEVAATAQPRPVNTHQPRREERNGPRK